MKVSRRDLLAGAAASVALGKTALTQATVDSSKVRGKPSRALGLRAPTEKPQRQPRGATSSGTPHQDLYGTITPADLHFERHHGGVPEIDPTAYSLLIHGMV
jgi:sulfane dehydrogenase subunit SoxC